MANKREQPFQGVLNKHVRRPETNSEASRHARRAYTSKLPSFSSVVLFFVLLFLFFPLIVIAIFSFNESKTIHWEGFSLRWYNKLFFDSEKLWEAFNNSAVIALISAIVATIIATPAAIGIKWYNFKAKAYTQAISFLPMILPEVILSMSMLIFFASVNIPLGRISIIISHITFCLPFVFLMVMARLDEFDFSTVEAAYDLGATEVQTLFRVVIPALLPGIISGFLIAVTLSIEDFLITFFVSGPGSTTLPLYVFSMIRYGTSPVINALSFIIILITVLVAYLLKNFLKTFTRA